jgi:cell division protein FtsI (penicillin-binding protein 3)
MGKRSIILSAVIACGFIAVVLRLVDIMLINHQWFLAKAKGQQTKKEAVPVKRGIIMDRRGRELAVNLETESIYCDPAEIAKPEAVAAALSTTINKNPEVILAKFDGKGRFDWIERKVSIEEAKKIKELKLKGIGFVPDAKRFYPKGTLASHIIGYVDIDNKGLEGIEQKYEKYLSARGEMVSVVRDARGNVLSEGLGKEIRGNNIVSLYQVRLQRRFYRGRRQKDQGCAPARCADLQRSNSEVFQCRFNQDRPQSRQREGLPVH